MTEIAKYLEQGVEFVPSTVGYLIRRDQVLLGLRKKVSLGLGENLIAGIGGKVDAGENDDEAFWREVWEEVKVKIISVRKMGRVRFIFPDKPKWNHNVAIYLVDEWEGEPKETEEIKPMWFNLGELPEDQMWKDNLIWLPEVLLGKRVEGIFLYGNNGEVVEHNLDIQEV